MNYGEGITSAEKLLLQPEVTEAEMLEVCLCDAVHFRLLETKDVFKLSEMHLCQRNSEHFRGFAVVREKVEQEKRGSSLKEKVEACCIEHHEWFLEKQILYSTELEVWMDLSYANPWILDLYHKALYHKKALYVRRVGPFTPLFIKLLLQKNGFDRVAEEPATGKIVEVVFGPHAEKKDGQVHFQPVRQEKREHALSLSADLASKLAVGNMVRDREAILFKKTDGIKRHLHELGYRLIGPSLWLLMQRLAEEKKPVGFTGPGCEFLTGLARSVQQRWSMTPEVVIESKASVLASLFPNRNAAFSLLPMAEKEICRTIIPLDECEPRSLFLEPLEKFFLALLGGHQAAGIQAAATAFVEEFALITRGLKMQLPLDPILREWRHFILSPSHGFLQAILSAEIVPGFNMPHSPWQARQQVVQGPWPTGSYLLTSSLDRWYIQMRNADRKRAIGEWFERLEASPRETAGSLH